VSTVRILDADDHPMFREGVRTMLAVTDDLGVVAEARRATASRHWSGWPSTRSTSHCWT
jgi:DNA-binding NarL/FixJ family response regulator